MIAHPKYKLNATADGKQLKAMKNKDYVDWGLEMLGVPSLWRESKGEDSVVGICDTGINRKHKDLKDAILEYENFTNDGLDDEDGHGTHVAGIIAARKNDEGVVGVAPESSLLVAKVLGDDGSGSYEWIVEGLKWCIRNGADIINLSLGGPIDDRYLWQVIHEGLASGVIFVVAAGNEGSLYRNAVGYPGRYGSVLTIGSHDYNGNPSGFSSRGGDIDFLAPGEDIWSTYGKHYASLSGTSMAAPFVSGLCALIESAEGKPLSSSMMKEELMKISAHPGYFDNATGYGPLLPFRYDGNL